ncbi:DUF6207 family protein [Streptomyces luteogriseus]|uniref:DUF6207 family protein n=1 Tax=Streptomyces luteogriseus TaxID=68233 RepID=UPI00379F0448
MVEVAAADDRTAFVSSRHLPGAGRQRRRIGRPGPPGEPGVRRRCYLEVRQDLNSQPYARRSPGRTLSARCAPLTG